MEIFITIILGVVGSFVAAIIFGLLGRILGRKTTEGNKKETVYDRLEKLTSSLSEATELIRKIESEIQARSELADKLQKDIQLYNELVDLKKSQVEAVAQLLRGELKTEGRRSFWKQFVVNFILFMLGAVTTLLLTIYT